METTLKEISVTPVVGVEEVGAAAAAPTTPAKETSMIMPQDATQANSQPRWELSSLSPSTAQIKNRHTHSKSRQTSRKPLPEWKHWSS